jgi:hypothetical protein
MRRNSLWSIIPLLVVVAALSACGQGVDLFGSQSAIPVTGVAPWGKIDLDPNTELVQPYILQGTPGTRLQEPAYLKVGKTHYCFYEVDFFTDATGTAIISSEIRLITSQDGIHWQHANDDRPVLVADTAWEGGEVGAPSVMRLNGKWLMWFAGGGGAGIGFAGSDDGLTWIKNDKNPVLKPDQQWEGGQHGVVGGPSVIRHESKYRMYYSGGLDRGPLLARRVGDAIGYADSNDGLAWTKRDGAGHSSANGRGDVQPVFTASQSWEGVNPATGDAGSVSSPDVLIDHPVDRDVYRMYYSGDYPGDPFAIDVSIGYAGSYDGLNWTALQDGLNPILQEVFPLHLPGLTQFLLYGEWSPSVIKGDDEYHMIYAQTDPLDTLSGLAIAINPPADH